MAIRMVHQDGDFVLSLDQNDQGRFLVMAQESGRLIWEFQTNSLVPAVARYLQGIADECGCYAHTHDEALEVESLIKVRVAR